MSFLSGLFGDPNKKEVDRYLSFVARVAEEEKDLEQKKDEEIKQASLALRSEIQQEAERIVDELSSVDDRKVYNQELKKRLNALLEPKKAYAFALVREAAKRTIGLRHYDVQVIGAAVLNQGQIAEMKTGEGKTLVASLALYLNALTGLGSHLITVNDYLARRDAGWMAPIYSFLGMSVGVIGPQFSCQYDPEFTNEESDLRLRHLKPVERRLAYQSDITYGTNNEFGFDYLRDHMAGDREQLVQRPLAYAIVDEVDSILIDEARTPLIISAPSDKSAQLYDQFAQLTPKLKAGEDYLIDEKGRTISLKDPGIKRFEQLLGVENLYDPGNVRLVHHADVALRAHALYKKNRDYVVKDGQVVIVDEFTGRMLHGRRYSGGLHQAIEAKERLAVQEESVTLATITFQNLFRLYPKLAGMTGTAVTEAEEFAKIYNLEVVVIPTHRQNQRTDHQDEVYKNEEAKFKAVVSQVKQLQEQGQPVLIGTVSIAKSEKLSKLMKAENVPHTVLNAKHHQKEGEIISQAGRPGAVTVATNMAGRGVDIILGGAALNEESSKEEVKKWEQDHQKVLELGGLYVIGTERHESRRIDNQLRGRAARQGDPGQSKFYLSMEDDLMRIFGGDRMKGLMEKLRIPEDMAINNPLLTKAIEQAQSRVETHNFEIRKHLVEYDDVMNKHREAIYRLRERVLSGDLDRWSEIRKEIIDAIDPSELKGYEDKSKDWTPELRYNVERAVSLRAIDVLWVEHLQTMEDLRDSIGLRSYGQREPLVEYKQEAFRLFNLLREAINNQVKEMLLHVQVENSEPPRELEQTEQPLILSGSDQDEPKTVRKSSSDKIGRNDPCPCGAIDPKTGKVYKYKKCGLINAPHHRG